MVLTQNKLKFVNELNEMMRSYWLMIAMLLVLLEKKEKVRQSILVSRVK